jgi:hypothetical protein
MMCTPDAFLDLSQYSGSYAGLEKGALEIHDSVERAEFANSLAFENTL